jgi:hypothetical protein
MTAVQTGEMIGSLAKQPGATGETLASNLGPIVAGGYGLLSGTVRGRGQKPAVDAMMESIYSSFPEFTAARRVNAPASAIYKGGWRAAVTGAVGGSEVPRQVRRASLEKSAHAQVRAGLGTGKGYQQRAFKADVQALLDAKIIDEDAAGRALEWAKTQPDKEISSYRGKIGRTVEEKAFVDVIAGLEKDGKITPDQAQAARDWADTAGRNKLADYRHQVELKFHLTPRPIAWTP